MSARTVTSMNRAKRFRPQRGGLRQSLDESKYWEVLTRDILLAHLQQLAMPPSRIVSIEPYGFDPRIGWDTHLVLCAYQDGSVQPAGFTDGPLP